MTKQEEKQQEVPNQHIQQVVDEFNEADSVFDQKLKEAKTLKEKLALYEEQYQKILHVVQAFTYEKIKDMSVISTYENMQNELFDKLALALYKSNKK